MNSQKGIERSSVIESLKSETFDVLIIGGGIFGSTALWQATQMGLKAALIESEDFGHGSSANSYKIIHGGIRYLQHFDFARVLSSCRERSAFLRIAPHLCEPLPIMIPTYGWGKSGMPFLGAGCLLFDLVTAFRNRGIKEVSRRIPMTRFIGREAVLKEFPDLNAEGLTGACIINDGRFYNPTRLVWAFCDSARQAGATVCNYMAADSLIQDEGVVRGVKAVDGVSGESISVNSRTVINAAGPWAERWLESVTGGSYQREGVYSRDACFVVKKNSRVSGRYTLAVQGETGDPDALLSRQKRHLFISPWRDYLLVGVWHKVTTDNQEDVVVENEELAEYIREINGARAGLQLDLDDVVMWNAGLVPFGEEQKSEVNLSYGKRSNLVDHERTMGLKNLITLIGLRYTMARGEAEKVIALAMSKLNKSVKPIKTDFVRLACADFESLGALRQQIDVILQGALSAEATEALVRNYGSDSFHIASLIADAPHLAKTIAPTTVTEAEITYICKNELVVKLTDIVFRRTDLATAGDPGDDAVQRAADIAASCLGWDKEHVLAEIAQVHQRFPAVAGRADADEPAKAAIMGVSEQGSC